jgi:hypothetical protein
MGGCIDPMFPLCDTGKSGGTCVQCMSGSTQQCMGKTPHCDLATELCTACGDDNDCGGMAGVCLASGSCADPTKIVHAISNGGSMMMATCGGIGAGNACDLDTALAIVRSGLGKNVIKLDDAGPYVSTMNNFIVDIDTSLDATIDARGAVLHHNGNGPIVTINDNKGVTILGGTIEGASAGGGDGLRCGMNATLIAHNTTFRANNESGIDASTCAVTVTNVVIRDNMFAGIEAAKGSLTISQSHFIFNQGGGITATNGQFVVVGNIFLSNGDLTGPVGGVMFSTSTAGDRLEFNTFTDNKAQAGVAPGIQCTATAGFTAQNNIVWNNLPVTQQVGGGCAHTYSDIGPSLTVVSGMGNLKDDPMLTSDGHLKPGSPALTKANSSADLSGIASQDVDGQPRIPPADIGADQVPK